MRGEWQHGKGMLKIYDGIILSLRILKSAVEKRSRKWKGCHTVF
jgi:hypothetical protein